MKPFGHRDRNDDPRWKVASATPIFAADPEAVAALAQECGSVGNDQPLDGVLVAGRHPTGWFVQAVLRDTLLADQILLFELVMVRSYMLVAQGPQAPVWQPTSEGVEWRSPAFAVSQ